MPNIGEHNRNVDQRIDTVLLDAAGTLIEPAEPVADTYAGIARQFGVDLDIERLSCAFGEVFVDTPKLAFSFDSDRELHRVEYQWWRDLVLRVLRRSGVTMDGFDEYFDRLYRHYAKGAAWVCYPEVEMVLSRLRAHQYHLAVVSNFDSRLPDILRELEIDQYLNDIIYSSRAGSAKPDQGIFRLALDRMGVEAAGAIHIGDSVEADVKGARSVGIDSLLIDRSPSLDRKHKDCIADLREVFTRLGLR